MPLIVSKWTQFFIQNFLAVQTPHMLFTGLEDYKAKGTQAAPYFAVTYYNEFAESKDMVLIRGDVVMPSKLSDSEAKWLLETTQSFYVNDTRYKLVERFNRQTHDFEFKDVLQALEIPNLWFLQQKGIHLSSSDRSFVNNGELASLVLQGGVVLVRVSSSYTMLNAHSKWNGEGESLILGSIFHTDLCPEVSECPFFFSCWPILWCYKE